MPSVIQFLIPDDDPSGIQVITVANWSGKAFVIPRGKLKEIKSRDEATWPAIYYLVGEGDDPVRKRVYIGESESFLNRLLNHYGNKEFWNYAVVFVGELDRADVKYLENKSVELAKSVGRHDIENHVEPLENTLSEAKKVAADDFFRQMKMVLSLLGLTLFEEVAAQDSAQRYYLKTEAAEAQGNLLENGEFIVYGGSKGRKREAASFEGKGFASSLRHRLITKKVIDWEFSDESFSLTEDYVFTSPSAAAATMAGRAINGWTAWKDKEGLTLDERVRQGLKVSVKEEVKVKG